MDLTEFESPQQFIANLETLIGNPSAHFAIPSGWLIAMSPEKHVKECYQRAAGDKVSLYEVGKNAAENHKDPFGYVETIFKSGWNRIKHDGKVSEFKNIVTSFELRRTRLVLKESDLAMLRAFASLRASGHLDDTGWKRFVSIFVWADGSCDYHLNKRFQGNRNIPDAKQLLKRMMDGYIPTYAEFFKESTQLLIHYRHYKTPFSKSIDQALDSGAKWFSPHHLEESRVFRDTANPKSLMLGRAENGAAIYYDGEASLITIGSPGTGKTQSQVIPNLLTYPGSAFVLDVKGELWDKTAGCRAKHFGPVYRFSPTNKQFRSHCFNPFNLISKEPSEAASQCEVLAKSLIPSSAANDQYWENRARDMVWAFAMLVAVDTPNKDARNLGELTRLLSFPTNFEGIEGQKRFPDSDTERIVQRLRDVSNLTKLAELRNIADSILDGVKSSSGRLSSVMDNAQSHLSSLSRSPTAAEALSSSNWHPLDLREKTGTTVYLSFKPGEMRAYAGIIRIILDQHANALTTDFERRPDDPPITFFLDEMPQLGFMETLNDLMDIGRGAGVRLWLFAQYMGQIRDNYGTRADGLISSAQIRCFMQPDLDAARFIAPQLGVTHNVLTGERKNMADINDLAGKKFGDKIIIIPRNEHPALLDPLFAYKTMPERMDYPIPEVPVNRTDEDWV